MAQSFYQHLNSLQFTNQPTRFHVSVVSLASFKTEEGMHFMYGFDKLTLVGARCISVSIRVSVLNSDLKVSSIS